MFNLLKRRPPAAETAPSLPPWEAPFDPTASATDILHCFRLLLGRRPNREEWSGHLMRVGEPLGPVVATYVNSLEFANLGLLKQDNLAGIVLADLPGFRIYAPQEDVAVGRYVAQGMYEPEVTAVIRRMVRPGMGVIDLGANIGYFTMLAAALVGPEGYVLAVEPNPANARLLEASRRANGFEQVTVWQGAAGRAIGLLTLNTSHSNGTTSTPSDDVNALLGSVTVPCLPVDALAARPIGLIKADVEGAEYNALLGCRAILARDRPVLVTEFSPDLMPGISCIDGDGYLAWIMDQGYEIGVIELDGSVTPSQGDRDAVMATYRARAVDHIDIVATPI